MGQAIGDIAAHITNDDGDTIDYRIFKLTVGVRAVQDSFDQAIVRLFQDLVYLEGMILLKSMTALGANRTKSFKQPDTQPG